jgi:hypothetical protein
MKKVFLLFLIAASATSFSCMNQTKEVSSEPIVSTGVGATGPDAIIYKTKAEYNNLVPVIMNAEKTSIVSFPGPRDLKYKGKIATPTLLESGFLLDNRGITENVAFLSITYDEYMALKKSPNKEELMALIIDNDPLTEMYNCGKRAIYKEEVEELNAIILGNDFSKFRKLK